MRRESNVSFTSSFTKKEATVARACFLRAPFAFVSLQAARRDVGAAVAEEPARVVAAAREGALDEDAEFARAHALEDVAGRPDRRHAAPRSPGGNEGDGGAPRIGGGEGDGGAPRIGGGGGGGGEGLRRSEEAGGDFFLSSPRRTQYHPQGRTCVNGPWHAHVGASVGRRHAGAETPRTTVG